MFVLTHALRERTIVLTRLNTAISSLEDRSGRMAGKRMGTIANPIDLDARRSEPPPETPRQSPADFGIESIL